MAEAEPEIISITIGRCECHYGEREGFLSAYIDVSHNPGPSASARASSTRHTSTQDHHIYSWAFYNSTASKDFHMRLRTRDITARLVLKRAKGSDDQLSKYILGVDIWDAPTVVSTTCELADSVTLPPDVSMSDQSSRRGKSVPLELAKWNSDTQDPPLATLHTPASTFVNGKKLLGITRPKHHH